MAITLHTDFLSNTSPRSVSIGSTSAKESSLDSKRKMHSVATPYTFNLLSPAEWELFIVLKRSVKKRNTKVVSIPFTKYGIPRMETTVVENNEKFKFKYCFIILNTRIEAVIYRTALRVIA